MPIQYMELQPSLNMWLREFHIDWLVNIHARFRLEPQTLFLSVNILDRFLSRKTITVRELPLAAIVALWIATKYDSKFPFEVKDCQYVLTRHNEILYTREEIVDMETEIAMTLGFTFTIPSGHTFLHRFLDVADAPEDVKALSSYYVERMLQDYTMLSFRPSQIAATAVCLAYCNPDRKVFDDVPNNTDPTLHPRLVRKISYSLSLPPILTPFQATGHTGLYRLSH